MRLTENSITTNAPHDRGASVNVTKRGRARAWTVSDQAAPARYVRLTRPRTVKSLGLADAEYLRSTDRARALSRRATVLQLGRLHVGDVPLGPALETVGLCWH